jgi:vacuolar protein-sorting-associated protein 4
MFRVHTAKQAACTLTEVDFGQLASLTDGFSGSDIKVVVREALMEPLRTLDVATHFKHVRAHSCHAPCHPLSGAGGG